MASAKEKLKAMMSSIREADETPVLNTHIQTSPEDAEAEFEEQAEAVLEQARAAARAQGRELTETEENFIGFGQALQVLATGMEDMQTHVLSLAAKHAALEKRFDALEKKLAKSR